MSSQQRLPLPTPSNGYIIVPLENGVLPGDVLLDILLRVPARTLCRLRAVCRRWHSLISDPRFAAAHAARHPDPLFAVCVLPGTGIPISNFYEVPHFPSPCEAADVRFLDASDHIVKRIAAGPWCLFQILAHQDQLCLVESTRRVRLLDPATGAATLLPENKFPSMYLIGAGGDGKRKVLAVATLIGMSPGMSAWFSP